MTKTKYQAIQLTDPDEELLSPPVTDDQKGRNKTGPIATRCCSTRCCSFCKYFLIFVLLAILIVLSALMLISIIIKATNSDFWRFCNLNSNADGDDFCCPYINRFFDLGLRQGCCSNWDCKMNILDEVQKKEEIPLPGTFGKHFCLGDHFKKYHKFEGGFYLAKPEMPWNRKKCVAYDNEESNQVPPDGYPVWTLSNTEDGGKEFQPGHMTRNVHHEDDPGNPVAEILWYFNLSEQNTTIETEYNGTHISIPKFTFLYAGYSRTYKQYNESETGIVSMEMNEANKSEVADYPKIAFVEKYHTLTYDGEKNTSRAEFIKEKIGQEDLTKPWRPLKHYKLYVRTVLRFLVEAVALWSGSEAGVDRVLTWQVRRYVNEFQEDNKRMNPQNPNWAKHLAKAKQAIEHAKDKNFEREYPKSEQGCKHFEDFFDGGGVSADDKYVTFALERPLTMFGAFMAFSPNYYMSFDMGHTTAHYDEETNVLQFYFQAFISSRQYTDAKFPGPIYQSGEHEGEPIYPSGMHLAPVAPGTDYVVDPKKDGRSDNLMQIQKPKGPIFLYSLLGEPDYSLFARPSDDTCDPKLLNGNPRWSKIFVDRTDSSWWEFLYDHLYFANFIIAAAPCSYHMYNDFGRDTYGFGVNEFGVWLHFLDEVPSYKTEEMGLSKAWVGWRCFYQNEDVDVCVAEA